MIDGYNSDIAAEQIRKLSELFPEVVVEGEVDFDRLRATLGDDIDLGERYGLNWKGKSGVFAKIQEKTVNTLHPQPDESVDWDTTQNMFIEGDNLEALKVLHKAYYGKVKMIYIDPPYNTGNDFVYNDDFKKTRKEQALEDGSIDEEGNVTRDDGLRINTGGHKHSNWLDMMYPRLFLARNLLRQDGVIFVSIDDNEVHNLRLMMNEIFGEENFVAQIPWRKRTAKSDVPFGVSQDYEWIVVFARSSGYKAGVKSENRKYYSTPDLPGRRWRVHGMTTQRSATERPNSFFTIVNPKNGTEYKADPRAVWRVTSDSILGFLAKNRIVFPGDYDFLNISQPMLRYFEDDDAAKDGEYFGYAPLSTNLPKDVGMTLDGTKDIAELFEQKVFTFPKPVSLMKYLIKSTMRADDIVIDLFSGSGTIAQAIYEVNLEDGSELRCILVQLPEMTSKGTDANIGGYTSIPQVARERIRRAAAKISKDFADKIAERETPVDLGFRSYTIGDSNFKKWNELVSEPEELKQQTFDQLNPLEDGVKDEDLLTEILLKRGISPLAEVETHDGFVFVPSESLVISLSRNMTEELFTKILAIKPSQIILPDQAFNGDVSLKTNLILHAEKQNIVVEVL